MKFLIRDDDTCAMTRPEELEACYREIWDEIPVGLSVTPFRIPGTSLGVLGLFEPWWNVGVQGVAAPPAAFPTRGLVYVP